MYLRFWKEAADRVNVSNNVRWLVEYLETHGSGAKAFEVASDAADTYSASGLATLAWLHEKRRQWTQAETLCRQESERYDAPDDLYDFYTRGMAAGQKRHAQARDALVADAFPDGQRKIGAAPTAPPTSGVLITGVEHDAQAAGLMWHDVIVAVDGIRVENFRQFAILRLSGSDPNMRFLLYRAGGYREVAATFKERKISAWFHDYPTNR